MKKVPVVDINRCTRCSSCIRVCPVKAISVNLNTGCAKCIKYCIVFPVPCLPQYISIDYDKCTSCRLCGDSCVSGAIVFMDAEKAEEEKIRHL